MRILLVLALTVCSVIIVNAQQSTLGETVKSQMIADWERAKVYTNEYLAAMPADKYSFRAQDSIRTFAQQMLHLASGNMGLSSNGTGKPRIWVGRRLEQAPGAQSKDSVSYFVNASYDYVIEGIRALDPSKLEEKAKSGNFEFSRMAWIMKAFEHQTHHRGQTTIYIRLVGVKPPNEKLF
jgi:uncharacterized damage-inducible protein DinB